MDPNFTVPIAIALIGIAVPMLREILQRRSGQMDALLKYQTITDRQAAEAEEQNKALHERLKSVTAGSWKIWKQLKRARITPEWTPPGVEPETGPLGKLK